MTLTENEIARREEQLLAAMRASNAEALDDLLADDLIFTHHLGGMMGKQDDLDAHRTGFVKVHAVTASDQRIRILGDVAIVTVRLDIMGSFGGVESSGAFRFTRVWAPGKNNECQLITAHSTRIAE